MVPKNERDLHLTIVSEVANIISYQGAVTIPQFGKLQYLLTRKVRLFFGIVTSIHRHSDMPVTSRRGRHFFAPYGFV